jgi:hypothetical protein
MREARFLRPYVIEPDGTARYADGQTIFFSFQRFKNEICKKGHCFVCGAPPGRSFNDEHVFPNWVLRHCRMHNETLTLPGGNRVKYGTYKIPCCEVCNGTLADLYEKPISKAVCGGYDSLITYLEEGGLNNIRAWLALIFLKVHLRDFRNSVSLNKKQDLGFIADEYELNELHHIHAVARAATAEIEIDDQVFGTLVILRVDHSSRDVAFDYCDNLTGRAVLLQVQDIALIYVLDDCGATAGMLSDQLESLPRRVSQIQLREVYARHLAANMHIKESPGFRTEFVGSDGRPRIMAILPELSLHEYQPSIFGRFFAGALGNLPEGIMVDGKTGEAARDLIATGGVSFLFDVNGAVIEGPQPAGEA